MENNYTMTGIIDIGSNSIRLAIYEVTSQGEYRLVSENKESARLSEKIQKDGVMKDEDIVAVVPVLRQFREICDAYGCRKIRVAATAAIRNAANGKRIVELLNWHTGLQIEILTGEQEASLGFLGVAAMMEIEDGFIIDIGGGSTEITLFRGRRLIDSVSLPLGAVNAQLIYGTSNPWSPGDVARLQSELQRLLAGHTWASSCPGLPLIGLGGTIRSLGKLDQRRRKYPLRVAHHYMLNRESITHYAESLPCMPLEKRKRIDGLTKARADIIVPGLIILQAVYKHIGAAHCLISGTGLREGLLMDTMGIAAPATSEVLLRQAHSLLTFHSAGPLAHFRQVGTFAVKLHQLMVGEHNEPGTRKLVYTAAMLYKIGSGIRYHQYNKHTLYWLTHAPIGGLNHREIVLCAYIADYESNHGKRLNLGEYKEMLASGDTALIHKLGTLVQIAVALDISETQCVDRLEGVLADGELLLKLNCRSQAYLEIKQLEAAAKNFKKVWNLKLVWEVHSSSTS